MNFLVTRKLLKTSLLSENSAIYGSLIIIILLLLLFGHDFHLGITFLESISSFLFRQLLSNNNHHNGIYRLSIL